VSRKRFEAAAARIDEKAIRHRDPNVLTDGWRKLKVLLFAERIEEKVITMDTPCRRVD
jgi:hypothetical protein